MDLHRNQWISVYSRITQIDRRSMLHVGELKHEVNRTTVCMEFVGPCFCPIFFGPIFFLGGGEVKLWSFCRQCFSEAIGQIYLKFCMSNFPRLILENLPSGFGINPIRNANSKFSAFLNIFIKKICIFGVWEAITQKLWYRFSPNLVQWCIIP